MKLLISLLLAFAFMFTSFGNVLSINQTDNYKSNSNKSTFSGGHAKAATLSSKTEDIRTSYKPLLDIDEYYVIENIRFQQVNSFNLLENDTILIGGREGNAGVCVLLDNQGRMLHKYRIDALDSKWGANVIGAMRFGEKIIAVIYDYDTNKSFIVLLDSDNTMITERFSGQIEAVTVLDDGLLICGSYYDKKKKEIPWAAKIGENGKYTWTFEGTPIQTNAPGARKHFEFCSGYADEYVLLQHEAMGYPDGNVYTMIRMGKNGSPTFSKTIDLPKMEHGCQFENILIHQGMLMLYGGVCNSEYQYEAVIAVMDMSAEMLWHKVYPESVGITAAVDSCGTYYLAFVTGNPRKVTIMAADEYGNVIQQYDALFKNLLIDVSIKSIIADKSGDLWMLGTVDNSTHCFISKCVRQ